MNTRLFTLRGNFGKINSKLLVLRVGISPMMVRTLTLFGLLVCGDALAQSAYGIYVNAGVTTTVPATSLGAGGTYVTYFGGDNLIPQNSHSLPPFGNADSVVAFDVTANALYSATSIANDYVLSAYDGILSLSNATSGGTADPNLGPFGQAAAEVIWEDQITVGGLPAGTPVTLIVTDQIVGRANFQPPADPQNDDSLYHEVAMQLAGTVCNLPPPFDCGIAPNTNYTASATINSARKYRFKAYSGEVLDLTNILSSNLGNGGGQWNASAEVEVARIYIDSLTAGAQVVSASGLDYSTPANQISVPSVAAETQGNATASLVSTGLTVGTIAGQSSSTVANGTVIRQVPAAGTDVPPLFPVNLIVSTGPSAKACSGDVSQWVSVSLSAPKYSSATQLYAQTATLTNTSSSAVKGPIYLIIGNLSTNATVQDASGTTTCDVPGSPYVLHSEELSSGASINVKLHFADPTKQPISWNADVAAEGSP